ncbi:MAG: hypothetical protein MJ240_02725 [Kiritimatiellae bacterium]|nr:hypothetical protein [Kiritimatiellia bacterium]
MKSKNHKVKLALLLITGAVLLASFTTFTVLLLVYNRGEDVNNEDAVRASAERACREGNHPAAVKLYRRLISLNPFEQRYQAEYQHALVRVRDFETLASTTNSGAVAFAFTKDELACEALIKKGVDLARAGSNTLAVTTFAEATNLNYFAATPFLIQAQLKASRPDQALTLARTYLTRFTSAALIQQTAELSAWAHRTDILEECRARALGTPGRLGIVLAHYCDALSAWQRGDEALLSEAITALNGEVKSPLARFLALECAANGDDAEAVERAFDEIVNSEESDSRLLEQARAVVKRYLSEHFPEKITLEHIQRLTNAIYDPQRPDVDILRLSILAKASRGVLLSSELDNALKLFPEDRGLQIIRKQQNSRN